jgi:hypothetical protein
LESAVDAWRGVPRPRMYELLRLKLVPGRVQLGRQIRINPDVLLRFLQSGGRGLEGKTQ